MVDMQPQQPYYGGPAVPPPNQYDFIFNAGNKRSNDWFFSASKQTKILIVSAAALVLLLVIWIGLSLFSTAPNDATQLTAVAAQQAEITRVAQSASLAAQQSSTKNFAITARLSLTSDEQALLQYLNSRGVSPNTQLLAQGKNANIDKLLQSAISSGTYDQTYREVAKQQLTNYAASLKQTYSTAAGPRERALLTTTYDHAQLLLSLIGQAQ